MITYVNKRASTPHIGKPADSSCTTLCRKSKDIIMKINLVKRKRVN